MPTQRVELLGYTLASVYMACTRPECQVLARQEAARDIWHRLVTEQGGPVRKLERLRAIRLQRPTRVADAPAHGRLFALRRGHGAASSEERVAYSRPAALEDVELWVTHQNEWHGRSLLRDERPHFTLTRTRRG